MLFNSLDFAIFLPIVFAIYWVLNRNVKIQNLWILISSYVFYGWWDWRFLSLIIFSSTVDYLIGICFNKVKRKVFRKGLLLASIIVNIGFLVYFKYYNFFVESFIEAFSLFGSKFEASRLSIVLPVGISFYTFQTLSYSIDVYKKELEPTRNLISFFAFVSFFPQLVAGPIERASSLLPQMLRKREFDYLQAVNGSRQILWGFFKKIVIADQCATVVNNVFANYSQLQGSMLLVGAVFFAFQIYGDFSGYSDIAIGTAKLFGFQLMTNFKYPYFSRDIAEFWRRWHISLSTWFRDYVYIPLGGSKGGKYKVIRNVFIIFIVSGFWHGANWTFIIWGGLNALYFLPLILSDRNRVNTNVVAEGKFFPTIKEFFQMSLTFCLTVIAWIFFRADSVSDAVFYIYQMTIKNLLIDPKQFIYVFYVLYNNPVSYFIVLLIVVEWIYRDKSHVLENYNLPATLRRLSYFILIFVIYFYFNFSKQQEFIYFQF